MTFLLGLLFPGLWRADAPTGGLAWPSLQVVPARATEHAAMSRQATDHLIHAPPPRLLT